ncbi:MAG: serine hydrolase [Candidatus Heimdallarchaeota archaeon]|nr:serine hydrolase [Candidatus Heimdallarchaeota archaeon]MCK4877792.1 serine hydrolase [Candidatus Heimdallarchaeota archaeon]
MNIQLFQEKFEREIVKVMRDLKVPGMSFFITKDGESIYERAFGMREKRNPKPVTKDTLFGVSSITKFVTCMGILQLHQANKLDIDHPISDYVPVNIGLKDNPIKIKHLMSHASGVPALHTFYFSQMDQELYAGKTPSFPLGNWDDFYFHINSAKAEVLYPPDTRFYYWNGGFALLGQIIEKVSGKAYEEYIAENILKPLEMNRSTYSNIEAEKDGNSSKGYSFQWVDNEIKRSPQALLSSSFVAGSGGLISSVVEMTNLLQCHLNGGEFKGKKILDSELILEMRKPHNSNLASSYKEYFPGGKVSYGYGLRVHEDFHGYTLITHGGISGVTGGQIGFIPELNLTYAQLYNVSFLSVHPLYTAFTFLVGKDPEEYMPYYKRRKHYKKLCGRYDAYKKILSFELKQRYGALYLEGDYWDGRVSQPLLPSNTNPEVMDFHVISPFGRMEVPFTEHNNGEITFEFERYIMHKKTIELEED